MDSNLVATIQYDELHDWVNRFVQLNCTISDKEAVKGMDLYNSFMDYRRQTSINIHYSTKDFRDKLLILYPSISYKRRNTTFFYVGICLKGQEKVPKPTLFDGLKLTKEEYSRRYYAAKKEEILQKKKEKRDIDLTIKNSDENIQENWDIIKHNKLVCRIFDDNKFNINRSSAATLDKWHEFRNKADEVKATAKTVENPIIPSLLKDPRFYVMDNTGDKSIKVYLPDKEGLDMNWDTPGEANKHICKVCGRCSFLMEEDKHKPEENRCTFCLQKKVVRLVNPHLPGGSYYN